MQSMNELAKAMNASDVELAGAMEAAARFLREAIAAAPDEVRPSVITDLGYAFGEAADVGLGLDEPEELFEGCAGWSDESVGHMLMQWIGRWEGATHDKGFKRAALDVADVLGPDHAKTLYRLAVLVTKLA